MQKNVNLNKRINGPWAHFESFLIRPENQHVGWIEWKAKQIFHLHKNPFSKHPASKYNYVVHEDICKKLPEQGLIRITDGEEYKEVTNLKNNYGTYAYYFIVENFEYVNIKSLPKPYLDKDGFLYRITQAWRDADSYPLFQKELAYNLLSCQKDFYGTGGIGVETFAPFGLKSTMNYLTSTVKSMLPNDFKRKNNTYQYKFIRTNNEIESLINTRNHAKTNELSYNNIGKLDKIKIENIPIQIPLIFPEKVNSDSYSKSLKGFDVDVFDYQMSALTIKPNIFPKDIEKLSELAIETSKYIGKEYTATSLELDTSSLVKIASSVCRLNLDDRLNESTLSMAKNDMFDMFKEYADNYQDSLISGGGRYNIPIDPMAYHRRLSPEANRLYKDILEYNRKNREIGFTWIRTDEIKNLYSSVNFYDVLQELNNNMLIIQQKNFSEIMVLNYNE